MLHCRRGMYDIILSCYKGCGGAAQIEEIFHTYPLFHKKTPPSWHCCFGCCCRCLHPSTQQKQPRGCVHIQLWYGCGCRLCIEKRQGSFAGIRIESSCALIAAVIARYNAASSSKLSATKLRPAAWAGVIRVLMIASS